MSRLRADEVLDRAGFGPFLASEGMNITVGKDISYVNGVTTFDDEVLTTKTINVNRINISDSAGTLNIFPAGRLGFQDGASAYFGDNDDLRIYYDGTDSRIVESSKLIIDADALEIHHANSKKFETNTTGIAVTGVTTSTEGWAGTTSSADVLGGIVMPFTCGVNGRIGLPPINATMVFGGSEYTGGGDNPEGVTMPHDGKLYAVTLNAEQAVGNLTLSTTVNGTQNTSYQIAFTSPTVSNPSPINRWAMMGIIFGAVSYARYWQTVLRHFLTMDLTMTELVGIMVLLLPGSFSWQHPLKKFATLTNDRITMLLSNLPMAPKLLSSVKKISIFLKQQKKQALTSLRRAKQALARLVRENSSLAP
jgi:hypothetical protein